MTDDKKTKFDPSNPPKNMTPRQVALWLERGRVQLAKEQAAEQLRMAAVARVQAAADAKATKKQTEVEAKAEKMAAMQTGTPAPHNVRGRQIARFLWMPQLNLSFKGFSFSFTLLTQLFAQILISARLLPTDHPAQSFIGAEVIGLSNLLREARYNIPPFRELIKHGTPEVARQYSVLISCYAVLVAGAASILVMFAQLVFGAAHAYAQTPSTSGTNIGAFNFTAGSGDMGTTFIDWIFGTGVGSTSLVSSGLGAMLGFYSNMALLFGSIIVLWIIISGIAETARTGIPFGKQFNHIWAPVRLIVALGLLVPLGSNGLNSGQYVAIALAKWGSAQATEVWKIFSGRMIATTTNGAPAQGADGISTVSFNQNAVQVMARDLFKVALCKEVYNTSVASNNTGDQFVAMSTVGAPITTPPAVATVNANGSPNEYSGSQGDQTNSTVTSQIVFKNNIDSNNNSTAATVDCGAINIKIPGTAASSTGAADDAAVSATQGQTSAMISLLNSFAPLAQSIAVDANLGTIGMRDPKADMATFQKAVEDFTTQYTGVWKSTVLPNYNIALATNMKKQANDYGWLGAPIWINIVADQNGKLIDRAQYLPTINRPNEGTLMGGDASNPWNLANNYIDGMPSASQSPQTSEPQANAFSIQNALRHMTNAVGSSPMSKFGAYGRELLSYGFRLISPAGEIDCIEDPFTDPKKCRQFLEQAEMSAVQNGSFEELSAQDLINGASGTDPSVLQKYRKNMGGLGGINGPTLTPTHQGLLNSLQTMEALNSDSPMHSLMFPIGMIMISFGFMAYLLVLIPFARFTLGVLNWFMQIFEMVLAMPLFGLSLLKTDGEGFLTQQAQTNVLMILGVILRPVLMVLGIAISLICFNAIMQFVNTIFADTVASLDPTGTDRSYLSMGVYMIFYGTLAYTLANSAFKAIDLMPNYVMAWLGARMESRVDDAATVQQQAQGYMQTMSYSARSGMGGAGAGGGGSSGGGGGHGGAGTGQQVGGNAAQPGQAGFVGPMSPAQQQAAANAPPPMSHSEQMQHDKQVGVDNINAAIDSRTAKVAPPPNAKSDGPGR